MQNLTEAQNRFLKLLFSGMSEEQALKETRITKNLYKRWIRDPFFMRHIREHIESCKRQAQILISNYLLYAATKLIELAGCDKEPVARQACLDILEMKPLLDDLIIKVKAEIEEKKPIMSEKAAEFILRTLAHGEEE